MSIRDINLTRHVYSFFGLDSSGLGRYSFLSKSLRISSMNLAKKVSWSNARTSWGLITHMTGILISNTACHSFQLSGTIENNPCKKGV